MSAKNSSVLLTCSVDEWRVVRGALHAHADQLAELSLQRELSGPEQQRSRTLVALLDKADKIEAARLKRDGAG